MRRTRLALSEEDWPDCLATGCPGGPRFLGHWDTGRRPVGHSITGTLQGTQHTGTLGHKVDWDSGIQNRQRIDWDSGPENGGAATGPICLGGDN